MRGAVAGVFPVTVAVGRRSRVAGLRSAIARTGPGTVFSAAVLLASVGPHSALARMGPVVVISAAVRVVARSYSALARVGSVGIVVAVVMPHSALARVGPVYVVMAAVWVVAGPHSALARVGLLLLVMTGVVLPHSAFARVGAVAVVTAVGRPCGAFPVAEGRVLSAGCCGPVRAWPISGAGGSGLASVRGSG